MAYETALIFGFLGVSYYLLDLSERFVIESASFTKATINLALKSLLRLTSIGTLVFAIEFLYLLMNDQVQSAVVVNILSLFDAYLQYIFYILVIFFILFFVNEFNNLINNFRLQKVMQQEEKIKKGMF